MKMHSRIIVFILSFLTWLALTGFSDIQEIIAGIIVALLVSTIAGHFLVSTKKRNPFVKRMLFGIIYFFKFIWEMIKANFHVAYIVVHPNLPIKPGIVKIKSGLKKEAALTILANSITLTPGTLTVDVNPENHDLYIHRIDIDGDDVEKNTKDIGGRFEPILTEVFE